MFLRSNKIKSRPVLGRMFWRIWLAMALSMAILVALMTLIWRLDVEHDRAARPGHEVVVRNIFGEEIGYARAADREGKGAPSEFQVVTDDGQILWVELPSPRLGAGPWDWLPWATLGWTGLVAGLGLGFMVLAFPVVRGLTRRLERLERGVQLWGEGRLDVRLPVEGRDEVAVLASRFNAAAARVEALVKSHKQLLANASHELRSPLARIRMRLALLEQAQPTLHEDVLEIEQNIRELDQLIDEVLLASRLEQNPEDVVLSDDVDLAAMVVEEASRFGFAVEVDSPLQVRGSDRLLQRLIRNLLENAKRYGASSEGVLDVAVALKSLPRGQWKLTVADRGRGIPDGWHEKIFEPFVRPPGSKEMQGSVGLGLSLVRVIARHHGLQVRCEAQPEGGTIFTVEPTTKFSD